MPSAAIDPLGAVRRPDRHPVAGLDAARDQRPPGARDLRRRAAANVSRARSSTSASRAANEAAARATRPGIVEGSWSSVMPTTCHTTKARCACPSPNPDRSETLRVERRGPVGWLVFDRPDAANAMNARMMDELERAWRELDADPDVRVIVNTGAGRAFQTGLDMAQLARDPDALREQSRRTKRFELRFTAWHNDVWKPVIAAVNGVCAGGGLHFVADADIVIASANATLRRSARLGRAGDRVRDDRARQEVADGSGAADGVRRPPRTAVGAARRTSSASARRSSIRPSGSQAEAQALGELIARNSPAALAHTKRALWGALERVSR